MEMGDFSSSSKIVVGFVGVVSLVKMLEEIVTPFLTRFVDALYNVITVFDLTAVQTVGGSERVVPICPAGGW
jgi:galactitol-specific phosphotransferase system IIC component